MTRTMMFVCLVGLITAMPAHAGQAAPGYAATDFATGFVNSGSFGIGPIGLAFDASGNLFVGDYFRLLVDLSTRIQRQIRDCNPMKSGRFDESHARRVSTIPGPPARTAIGWAVCSAAGTLEAATTESTSNDRPRGRWARRNCAHEPANSLAQSGLTAVLKSTKNLNSGRASLISRRR